MTGLTARQQWSLDHITRCTCGSWLLITERQRLALTEDFPPVCPHINHAAMEAS